MASFLPRSALERRRAVEVRRVGEALGRMIEVALQVDHRRPLRQDALAAGFPRSEAATSVM